MTRAGSRQALRQALAFALEGLRYAARTQRAFRIQLVITAVVGVILLGLRMPALESAVTVLSILVVLVVELINTGVEVVVDLLVERNHHALAKVAKDVAAAAVVVAAAGAAVVGLLILGPPLGSALGLGAGTAARWSRIGAVVALLAGAGALLWIGARGRSSS
ncbi:MAG: diacylglycerol kinase family protein [Bacillati bacterium ANGP1]|uniref:Diacylglycerol kinase family protein n=1 Tax=Candidatus Segetimicrobium genomatis TaxID=2569760 RepID=A0A537L3Z5_9BACT|nr:MAG: hypothetical protein AUI83_12135 [Armatimonadetes bacterium 13_1_40CM_3_65_7]TMJ02740.1 MAG: diacylglycerol kinase family protein [Terrabacteria group bacterium ANGP1]TMJ08681.1 MAG: diacylglycerol kinase family protein [Terrabacteria group bacterium ANGP1]